MSGADGSSVPRPARWSRSRCSGSPADRANWIDRQFATPPHQDVSHGRSAIFASVIVGVMGALFVYGMLMLQHSLELPPDTRTASGELLRPRLDEIQFFVVLVVAALVLTTAIFSTGLARTGDWYRDNEDG